MALAGVHLIVVDVVDEVERCQRACQEEHHHAEEQVLPVQDGFDAVLGSPLRDGGSLHVEDVALGHRELGAKEHRRHCHAQQDGTHDAVDE